MRSRERAPVGMLRKRLEQIELQRRHRHLASLLVREPVCGEVEHASSDAHPFGAEVGTARGRRAAQHALDAGHQLTRVEGLGDVVVGTHLEAHDPIHDRGGGSQHDDRDLRVALAQVPRKTQAVLAGHVDVDQRQVDGMLGGHRPRGAGALGAECRVAVGDEVFLQHLAHVRLVVDDQDCGFWAHGRCSTPSSPAAGERSNPRRAES